jgi:hypothetical protein
MNTAVLVGAFVCSMTTVAVAPAQVLAATPSNTEVASSTSETLVSLDTLMTAACTTPTLDTGAASSPYISGSGAITLTADSTCPGGTEYRFLYRDTSLVWHYIGTYGTSNTASWNADYKAGTYVLQVRARPVGSTALYVTYKNLAFSLSGCGLPSLIPDLPSPQLANTTITWTANTTCSGTAQYKFMVRTPGGVWSLAQDWDASATLIWNSPATRGSYLIEVLVRNAGAIEDPYDSYKAVPYVIGLCTTPTLDTGVASSPYATGSGAITLTASASCQGASQYRFLYRDAGLVWHYLSAYRSTNTANWAADYKPGNYLFQVRARPAGSTSLYVTYKNLTFALSGCGVASLSPDLASPQRAGTTITWTASAACSGIPEYKFLLRWSYCGAPANPWSYTLCGQNYITRPPSNFCGYFSCIPSFWQSTNGWVARCVDGKYSHSGGRSGACSHHGGVAQPLHSGFWSVPQTWSTSDTLVWSSAYRGPYAIEVLVRNSGAVHDPYDHYKTVNYTLN